MIKKILIGFALILFLQIISFAASSSTSYKITAEILDSGGISSSSTSYRLLGKTREWDGFLKSVYFKKEEPTLAPIVTSLSPNSGANTGIVIITNLAGANFRSGASVKLTKSGQTDILGTNVVVVSSTQITCTFDLTGKINGLWDATVTNTDGKSGSLPSAFTVNYPAPTINSITPAKGLNNAVVAITDLSGANFRIGITVALKKSGDADIKADNVVVVSSSKVTCNFDLNNKTSGAWDVYATNDDNQAGILTQGFKVETPNIVIIGQASNTPNPFNPSKEPTMIKYKLSKDADVAVYIHNIRGERVWQFVAPAGSNGGKVGDNEIPWDGITAFRSIASSGVYIVYVTAKDENGAVINLGKTKMAVIK